MHFRSTAHCLIVALTTFIVAFHCHAEDLTLTSPHAKVSLISDTIGYTPGATLKLGFHFKLDPDWHVYWKNPGDSGSAPKFDFQSNESISFGEIEWPEPKVIPVAQLVNFGYENEVLLQFPVTIASNAQGTLHLSVRAEWLVCKEDCIPGEGRFDLSIKENHRVIGSEWEEIFSQYEKKVPKETLSGSVTFLPDAAVLSIPKTFKDKLIYFFPEEQGVVSYELQPRVKEEDWKTTITISRAISRQEPAIISGVLSTGTEVFKVNLNSDKSPTTTVPTNNSSSLLRLNLLFAFLGGIILNVMPCVFPVIGIKVLSLLEEAEMKDKSRASYVSVYTLGIASSLWILFAMVVWAKSVGKNLGWGFQLQDPIFVGLLFLLFFTLGCNLLGLVEFHAPFRVGAQAKRRHHYIEAFLSGMLTTIVATPCTAPFMGASVAFALQAGTAEGFLVFTFLAIGLSFPYIFFSFFPQALSILPRPGKWMSRLKGLLAFPLLGACIWLLWILEQQTGGEGVITLLGCALLLSFAFWIKHEFGGLLASPRSRFLSLMFFILVIFGCGHIVSTLTLAPQKEAEGYRDTFGQSWIPYNKVTVDDLVGSGRIVYIDLTASWCVTCQVNKAVVFSSNEVRDFIRAKNIALVRGDWTTQDPAITEVIQSFGKAGVPLNVILKKNVPPVVLPTVLTPSIVLGELQSITEHN